jgi:hypothetical protein
MDCPEVRAEGQRNDGWHPESVAAAFGYALQESRSLPWSDERVIGDRPARHVTCPRVMDLVSDISINVATAAMAPVPGIKFRMKWARAVHLLQ